MFSLAQVLSLCNIEIGKVRFRDEGGICILPKSDKLEKKKELFTFQSASEQFSTRILKGD